MTFTSRTHRTRQPGARAAWLALALVVSTPAGAAVPAAGSTATAALPSDSTHAAPWNDPDSGAELLGRPAPLFRFARWLDGPPLTVESLHGKVVLVRFWTDECRFCRSTLPAIEVLRRRYADRGLVVIGAYHPGRPGAVKDAVVRSWAKRNGFAGTLAVDAAWGTLNAWWLDGHPDRNWVSASFLIDRDGTVRWVHGGGEYHPSEELAHRRCDVAYAGLEREIRGLLERPELSAPASRTNSRE